MIIQVNKVGDVLVFKMPTGEEVLAKLISESDTSFKVSKPATLLMIQGENGEVGVDMQITLLGSDINNTVEIMKAGILMVAKARKDLADAYIQNTSGIQIAGAIDGLQSSS